MGLSVVHGLVKNHGGDIALESREHEGTLVTIYMPAMATPPRKETTALPDLPRGTERVLFVDDEGALVDIVKDMLERFGYRVEAHKNPVEALERFREAPDTFDLIITDLSMPFMTGDQLIRHVLNIRPAMPIVLCTGFHDDMSDDQARAMGLRAVFNKPVNLRDLITGVRTALDNPA
jgi:CheY-like chemotaxis protein